MLPSIFADNAVEIGGVLTGIGAVYTCFRKIFSHFREQREARTAEILRIARHEAELVRQKLEAKIQVVELELQTQKESVSKDLSHLKETYNAEIRALAEKIETLRSDLSIQHQSLVALLTRLVDNK